MPVDYESFKKKSWSERIGLFNSISAEERAALVRTHVTWWLNAHRDRLSPQQIAILEENIAAIVPELYVTPKDRELTRGLQELETRTAALLSRDQMRQALTMHWKPHEWD